MQVYVSIHTCRSTEIFLSKRFDSRP